MRSKLFIVRPVDAENAEKLDEDFLSSSFWAKEMYADKSPIELSLDDYCEEDFAHAFYGCSPDAKKVNDGFAVTLPKDKIRDYFAGLSDAVAAANAEFRRQLEKGNPDSLGFYRLSHAACTPFDLYVYDTDFESYQGLNSWLYDQLVMTKGDGCDSVQFKITQIFDWDAIDIDL